MLERRLGQDEPVDMRHRHAHWKPRAHHTEQPARRQAMDDELVAEQAVCHRNDDRRAIGHESKVADLPRAENRSDRVEVIRRAFGQARDGYSLGCFHALDTAGYAGPVTRASETTVDRASDRGAREIFLDLEMRRGALRKNLAETLRSAIQDGRLVARTWLPSSRTLATDLGVSRGVVTDAYEQLAAEGYLDVKPRTAPAVAPVGVGSPRPSPDPSAQTWTYDFTATTPDVSLFPRRAWAKATERVLRRAPDSALDYGDHRGRPELRNALSEYLGRVRGVRVDPARVVITQGYTQALDLICRVLVTRSTTPPTVAIESPSLPDAWDTIRYSGARLDGWAVDAHGVIPADPDSRPAAAVVLTPAHQFPTGAVLAPDRRAELLAWAASHDALIIEDDYDAEFRYDRTPVGALQGLEPSRVAHVGTAGKTLAPGLRLGWLSLPDELVDDVRRHKAATDSGSPAIDQLVLADLLTTGEYERHVVRMRRVYRQRRDRMVDCLSGYGFSVVGPAAGLHVLLHRDPDVDEEVLAQSCAQRGIAIRTLGSMHVPALPNPARIDRGLLLGYGRLRLERIPDAVHALSLALSTERRLAL